MAPPAQIFALKSILEKDKLNGTNFTTWYRNLRIVLKHDKKEHVLEDPLPEVAVDNANATTKNAYQKLVDESTEISCLMLACWYVQFASWFITVNYYVFNHYFTLWYNSYTFSLLICKIYMKRENAGSWNSGPKIATSEIPILKSSNWPEISRRFFTKYNKILVKSTTRGDPPVAHKATGRAPPGRALLPCGAHS